MFLLYTFSIVVIEMEGKMFEIKGKFGSAKQNVFKVFRLIRGIGKGDLSASSYMDADKEPQQPKTSNVQAYLTGKRRMHEIETQKAMIIVLSRHNRWKAGGPV